MYYEIVSRSQEKNETHCYFKHFKSEVKDTIGIFFSEKDASSFLKNSYQKGVIKMDVPQLFKIITVTMLFQILNILGLKNPVFP